MAVDRDSGVRDSSAPHRASDRRSEHQAPPGAGGTEVGASHYPLIVALHAAWLGALWWFALGRPINFAFLALFVLVELGRVWVLRTLGPRWTTRIIVVPGEALVAAGPYRFVNHPNYLVVIAEIAVLPLVFGLWQIALVFSLLNAAVLAIRVRAENRALGAAQRGRRKRRRPRP
ncbi:isoprenylcysteine carboxyl methyltransferase family protein [Sphingomonas daechungensis]|uniref:isoprenylcysteine carboxyl methyltransferase family protein n=1 Tax=Sphingomonas daechungensis TaxID=1176646 RepID=UPI001CB8ABE6|nr:isoprenylcysteine carboxylmethyltransferase family protein [Sphingomonas daechungensis]